MREPHEQMIVWTTSSGVVTGNKQDDFYCELFQSRNDLEEYISELRAAADKVWPS